MAAVFEDANAMFDFVAKKGNGIKGLVDLGIEEVPELYTLPPKERFDHKTNPCSSHHQELASVPIDLSKLDGPERDQVVDAIVRASESFGFFQVINHGVELELMESLKETAHRFFALPAEAKAVYLKGSSQSPLVKYTTSFSPETEKVLEWRDHINLIYTNDDDVEKQWPKDCKDVLLDYIKQSSRMVRQIVEILVEHLGVKFENSNLESLIGFKIVNMNYYPKCPDPELTIGAGRHSDMGTLTVLLQDEIGGLFVKADQEWVEIPPISGALVINLGDTLQIMSNGRYKSAEHKVVTTSKQSRVSIPHFISSMPTDLIGPLPHLVERDGGTIYREVVYKDYMINYFARSHDGKNHVDFAKINYVP